MKKYLFLSMLLAACGGAPDPSAEATEKAENEAWFKVCGTAQAYVLAKGAVKQAIHSEASTIFPRFDEAFVQGGGGGQFYVVTAYFLRADQRVPFEVGLVCNGGDWQFGNVKINGMDAKPGMNL